jgi:hypothetical protein
MLVVLAGAASSLESVLHAGRNNNSVLLVVLFVCWVLAPFIALLVINRLFKVWTVQISVILFSLTLFLTIGSLICYNGLLIPSGTKPAGIFLVVPLVSWILIGITLFITLSISRRHLRNDKVSKL